MSHPEINIDRFHLAALGLALQLVHNAREYPTLSFIKLEAADPETGRGRLIATDGFALVISENAHDSAETRYVRPSKRIRLSPKAHAVAIVGGELFESLPRSQRKHRVDHRGAGKYSRDAIEPVDGVDAAGATLRYPDVDRVVPAFDRPPVDPIAPVDAVEGGELAQVYARSAVYDHHLFWARTSSREHAYLQGTADDDFVLFKRLREPVYDRYNGPKKDRRVAV